MTIENAIGICQNTTRHSWGDLDHIIDLMNQGQFGSLDETTELRNILSEKIQSLAMEECAPYISVLSRTEIIRNRNLCLEDFYYDGITHEYSYLWKKLNNGKQSDWLGNDTRPVHIYEAFDVATVYDLEQLYHPDYIFLVSEKRSFQNYLQSLTNASVGYHLFVMIEIEQDNRMGLLFSKSGKWNPYQKHPRYYSMESFKCRMIYAEGKDIHEIDGAPGSPKFLFLLKQEKEEDASSIAICNSVKDVNNEEYYCFDYGHDKTFDFSRKFAGDPLLKQAINRTKSPFLLRKQRYATSPAIIIDFLTMKAISFVKKSADEDGCIFLLNDNHIAVTLSNDYLTGQSNYTRYKRATDKLNDKLGRKFNSLEAKVSSVPGLQFHCSSNEREVFISEIVPSILYGKQRNKIGNGVSKGIILNPCGFDISKYLEKLENKGFIKAIKGGPNNSIILRYEKMDSCTISDIVLFAFIMNCKMSSAYEALSNEKVKTLSESPRTKKEWDILYDMTGWGTFPDENKVDKKYETNDFQWKKTRREQEYSYNRNEFPYTGIGQDQIYTEKYQFRTKYFSQLFSMSERTFSSLKQAAALPVRAKSKHRDILDCILEVDASKSN